jgi:hypothetical protein
LHHVIEAQTGVKQPKENGGTAGCKPWD